MPDSTVFRTPADIKEPTPLPKGKDPIRPMGEPTQAPIALYEEIEGKPYSAVHFDVEGIWDSSDSLSTDLRAIDSYYRSKVQSGAYEDGVESYKQLIQEAEKATGTKNANFNLKVAKVAEFVRFMEKMDKIDNERERWQ